LRAPQLGTPWTLAGTYMFSQWCAHSACMHGHIPRPSVDYHL